MLKSLRIGLYYNKNGERMKMLENSHETKKSRLQNYDQSTLIFDVCLLINSFIPFSHVFFLDMVCVDRRIMDYEWTRFVWYVGNVS